MFVETNHSRHLSLASRPVLPVTLAVAVGIVLDRAGWFPGQSPDVVTWWLAAAAATGAGWTFLKFGRTRWSFLALLVAAVCVGGTWHRYSWNSIATAEVARFASEGAQPVCLEAVALNSSTWYPAAKSNPLRAIPAESRSDVLVEVTRLRNGTHWQPSEGRTRLRIRGTSPPFAAGDHLRVYARLGKSRPQLNPGQYDYAAVERSAGRHCELYARYPECVTKLPPTFGHRFARWLAEVREYCQQQIATYVDSRQSPMVEAILLGSRNELSEETLQAFMKTGTIHLLVVSGLNVGLLAVGLWNLFGMLPFTPRWRLACIVLLVIGYAGVVGGQPPVVRASVLVVATLFSTSLIRHASSVNLLAVSAMVVMALNPGELFRPGTQLSFLGVAAVVGGAQVLAWGKRVDPLERMLAQYRSIGNTLWRHLASRFRDILLASTIVWVIVAPLVLYHFHIVSPAGLLITPIVWPLIAVALLASLGICIFGFLFPPLAWLLGQCCEICMSLLENLVGWASNIPASHIFSAGPARWWLIGFYGALGLIALVPRWQRDWKWPTAVAALWVALGFVVGYLHQTPRDLLRCAVLSVGHGTCVVLQLPSGQTVLYDAGSLGTPEQAANIVSGYLWSEGISQIDAIVISHSDVDHYNGLPGLFERFSVGGIFVSPLMFDPWENRGRLTAPNFLRESILAAGIPLREVWMNDRLHLADEQVNLEVLHPPRDGVLGRDNANSILLLVEYAGHRVLLPGDLESPGIESVIGEPPLDCDILLAPHHGSSHSDPPGFAAWCSPEWVVLSGGQTSADSQITTTSYRTSGAKIFHTAETGAVAFDITPHGITHQQFRYVRH